MRSSAAEWTISSRWVFPVGQPPIAHGSVTIAGERIISIAALRSRPLVRDLGNVAIIPGLVNAHTHLDLTGLHGHTPPGPDFTRWLRAVIDHRRTQTPEQNDAAIAEGLAESLRFGTTLLGDISARGGSWSALSAADFPGRAVVFYELLGLSQARTADAWQQAGRWLDEHPATQRCRPGLSPHAPYSVSQTLFQAAAARAQRAGFPLAVHLAEARDELELLEHQRGPFVDFLKELGVWDPSGLVKDIRQVSSMNEHVRHFLIAHGNYLSPADVPRHGSVIYCPRTHAAFGQAPYPLREYLAGGVRVALGTDSLASNPDLSVLAEACLVRELFPEMPGESILRMATLSGAEALGWEGETGSLTAGKSADLVVVRLPNDEADDPHDLLWRTPLLPEAVLIRGQWLDTLKLADPSHN
jgi:aminodeoxyfutalosine deaminase